jgi:uncharacterized protein (TIGR03067 family)
MRTLALLVLALAAPQEALKAKDLDGTWKGARFTEGRGEDMKKGVGLLFTFKDGKLSGFKESGAPLGEATFTLSADGKQIDATGTTGAYRGKLYVGILKLDGDTLLWCTTGVAAKDPRRPGDFVANPGDAQYLIVLKRQK